MIEGIALFQQVLWAVNSAAGVFLLILLVVRKNSRIYPVFSFYILANFALGALAFVIYCRWGFSSPNAWRVTWGMQALVIGARALAVTEVCRRILARFRGIWALAWRILLACTAIVLLYSGLAASHGWKYVLPKADRGLELSFTAVIVVVLFFARSYHVPTNPTDRSLAAGFCLYSCFRALNDTVLENYLNSYWPLWNVLEMLAFLASLLVWTWALRKTQTNTAPEEDLLPAGIYQTVVPQINDRLRLLNEQLSHLWHAEKEKS